jgi:hypothetical protein
MGGAIPDLQPSTFELGSTYSETSASRTRRPPAAVLLVYGANVEAERCQQACGYPSRKPWFPPYEAHASRDGIEDGAPRPGAGNNDVSEAVEEEEDEVPGVWEC